MKKNVSMIWTCAAVVALAFTATGRAYADTQTVDITFNPNPTINIVGGGYEDSEGFAQFNPALGTLESISFSVAWSQTYTTPSGGAVYLAFSPVGYGEIVENDNPNSASFSINSVPVPLSDFAAFTGTGDASLEVSDNGAGESLYVDFSSVSVTYTYTPSVAATPEPSSLALLGTGALGVAATMRRRFLRT
ncbi:MAG TPA: PEP-CTERM sorting domain-containing protein [Candidatus Aquilonibacter sp.]|nr:PEP-CTERM sorting domain-containing protein [Candidatus Aquilonibacter sp.]